TLLESVFAGGPWLGVALVQVTLVALLGLLAWLVARRGGPALRGAVLLAALVVLLIVPGLATVAPVWLPLPDWWSTDYSIAAYGWRIADSETAQSAIRHPQSANSLAALAIVTRGSL